MAGSEISAYLVMFSKQGIWDECVVPDTTDDSSVLHFMQRNTELGVVNVLLCYILYFFLYFLTVAEGDRHQCYGGQL